MKTLISALLFLFWSSFTFAGSISFTNGLTLTVADLRCETVKAAYSAVSASAGWVGLACTSEILGVGSRMSVVNFGSTSSVFYLVSAVNAPSGVSVDSLSASVTALEASAGTGGTVEPFDYSKAAALFSFFFAFVVGVWIVGKNIGLILNAVRHW